MATTHVFRLDAEGGRRLYEELGRGAFEFRSVPYARFSARGEDAIVTLYTSGKLVVQGAGADAFCARFLPDLASSWGEARASTPARDVAVPTVGSDESGKGDYFGPLVVAAALVTPEDLPFLREAGVQDSKSSTDAHIRRVEGVVAKRLAHAVRVLEPETYNDAWARVGNVNRLLGRLHAEVIDEVVASAGGRARAILVDRFAEPILVTRHLGTEARSLDFEMTVRAESHPAVAAASFLARAAFLRSFEALKDLADGQLYLGASDPRIVPAARKLLRDGGEPWLKRFAKLHFRTTEKARNA